MNEKEKLKVKAKKKVVDIKLYSDSLEIYWEDGKGGLGGDRFENLNHVVGKYSRAEWLRDSIIMEYDRESQQEILDSLRRFGIRPNKPFFAKSANIQKAVEKIKYKGHTIELTPVGTKDAPKYVYVVRDSRGKQVTAQGYPMKNKEEAIRLAKIEVDDFAKKSVAKSQNKQKGECRPKNLKTPWMNCPSGEPYYTPSKDILNGHLELFLTVSEKK